jgi:adenosylmethionine-8-amino-7-oxononanoate aminotransferase
MFDVSDIWQMDHDQFLRPRMHYEHFDKDGSLGIVKARTAYVVDISGSRYRDGIGGVRVLMWDTVEHRSHLAGIEWRQRKLRE